MGDIWLAGRFEVKPMGEQALPMPPTKACGVLLILLADRYPDWVSRREIGEALHSDSPKLKRAAAVRQTLARLKGWMPDQTLQLQADSVKLSQPWRVLVGGAGGLSIAPGMDHPWMDDFRRRHTRGSEPSSAGPEVHLFQAIQAIAASDPDTARNILCAAPEIALLLPRGDFAWAVGATRPRSRQEPNAAEHDNLVALAHYLAAEIPQALSSYLRAYSIAEKRRDQLSMAKFSSQVMFAFLESGDMESATKWLEKLMKSDREQSMRLLALNAKAAYFWNSHLLPEALATLRSAERYANSASRVEQIHYLTNLAVLEAESGEVEAAPGTIERARALLAGQAHRAFKWNLDMAEAEVLSQVSRTEQAMALIDEAIQEANSPEVLLSAWYLRETQAEITMRARQTAKAQALWRATESERASRNLTLTPRLQARKHRILGH